jgi:hypothetical protein
MWIENTNLLCVFLSFILFFFKAIIIIVIKMHHNQAWWDAEKYKQTEITERSMFS